MTYIIIIGLLLIIFFLFNLIIQEMRRIEINKLNPNEMRKITKKNGQIFFINKLEINISDNSNSKNIIANFNSKYKGIDSNITKQIVDMIF